MIEYIIWYFIPGLLWAGFLEWFTTTKLEGEFSRPWFGFERFFHVILWPFSFMRFVVEFFKGMFEDNNEDE